MQNVVILSRRLRWLFSLLLWVAPIVIVLNWSAWALWWQLMGIDPSPWGKSLMELTMATRVGSIFIDFIPGIFWMLSLYYLARLFGLYENKRFFEAENIGLIKRVGLCLFLEAIAKIFVVPMHALHLTFDNPVGERLVALSFGVQDLSNIAMAAIVFLVAYIMEQAHYLEIENALTV